MKRMQRDDGGDLTIYRHEKMVKELGDIVWYAAAAAKELKMNLSEVLALNLDKLRDREERGTLKGSGDER